MWRKDVFLAYNQEEEPTGMKTCTRIWTKIMLRSKYGVELAYALVILFNHERMAATSEKRSKHPIEHYCKSHQHAPTNKRFGVLKRMNRLSANLFRLLFWRRYLHRLYHCFLLTNQWSVSQTAHIRLDQIPFMQSTSSDFFNSIMFFAKRKTKCGWRAFKSTTKIMESIWKKGCSWWELPLLFNGIQP